MRRALKSQSRGEVVGVIDPRLLYDTAAVMAYAGIGELTLREWKKQKLLEGLRSAGGRVWYRGSDLIRVIEGK
jgi:hypothetical protein